MKNSFKPLATGELYQRNPQQSNAIYQYVNVLIMKDLSDLRFFRLLSEHSQKEFAVNDFTAALQELANHLVSIAIKEQDYAVLLRYFSFGLNRLKSYRVQFEQGEKRLVIAY